MNDTTENKIRTRNVLSSECKEWIATFVKRQMTYFFGSEKIGEEVSFKIIKDVMANVGQFSDYNNTHQITEKAAIAGLQKRILRSIGIHVSDDEILNGAQRVIDRMEKVEDA